MPAGAPVESTRKALTLLGGILQRALEAGRIPTNPQRLVRKAAPDLPFCTVASPDADFSPDGWWHTREGRKTAFYEWVKTIAYSLGI